MLLFLSEALHATFRFIIPKPEDRQPLTPTNALFILCTYLPFVYLAYLARRPNTYFRRLVILPIVLIASLAPAFRFYVTIPSLNVYNWAKCLLAEVIVAKSLEYALTPEGMLKIGEVSPGVYKGKRAMNGHIDKAASPSPPNNDGHFNWVPQWLADAFELIHTMRGLQWKFSEGAFVPAQTKPLDRGPFLRATFRSLIINFLLFDLLESLIKLFPGIGTIEGSTMFYPDLPPLRRYAVSSIVHTMAGCTLLVGFEMVYSLIILIAVGVCNSKPSSWPPAMGNPWTCDSMHKYWARDWHQFLRRTFLVVGGIPGKWVAGDIGMVFGAFLASALFHETAIYNMGKGLNIQPVLFFVMQVPILIGERVWRVVTGKRVGGWPGRLWVYTVLWTFGQPMVDSWFRRGLGGAIMIPPFISPARLMAGGLLKYIRG